MTHQSNKVPPYQDPDAQIVSVGLCQVETHPFDCDGNRKRVLSTLEEAGKLGCQVAVTPECVIHGYGFIDDKQALREKVLAAAEEQDGPLVRAAAETARRYSMAIAVGYAEKEGERIYNSTTLLDANGEIAAHYRKVHLRDFEASAHGSIFDPGNEFPVVDLRLREGTVRTGLMICFDREIAESVRCLRSKGAELILCPLACDTCRLDGMMNFADNEMVTRVRAAENEVFIVVVNHSRRFNGGTLVVGPAGECIKQLGEEPEVARVDLHVGGLRKHLRADPWSWMGWGYLRPEVYAGEDMTRKASNQAK